MAGENGGKERRERKWRIKEIKYKTNHANKISTDNLTETKRICQQNKENNLKQLKLQEIAQNL